MSTAVLCEKLTFDEQRRRSYHTRIAVSCRDAARQHPEHVRQLRSKMRLHALQARGKIL